MKSTLSLRLSAAILALLCLPNAAYAIKDIYPPCNGPICNTVQLLEPSDLQPYYTSAQIDKIVDGLNKQILELQLRLRADEGFLNQLTNLNSGDNLRALVRQAVDQVSKTKQIN